jgi:nifR3 family TIM-barrel protein
LNPAPRPDNILLAAILFHASLKTVKIGNVDIKDGLILAPMSGVTDLACRQIAREHGAGLAFSEMVSAAGVALKQPATLALLFTIPDERPRAWQLFGSDEGRLASAAAHLAQTGADLIDLNCGCPVRKVVKTGSGAALLREPEKIGRLVAAMVKASGVPVTVKVRSGWDSAHINATLVARIAQDSGAAAVTVHPRTAVMGFSGKADWGIIKLVKEVLRIPVIGNGDVASVADASRMVVETGCDAVMVGRAAMGNPWIFSQWQFSQSQFSGTLSGNGKGPTLEERRETALRHFTLLAAWPSAHQPWVNFRRCLMWYTKGLPRSAAFRNAVMARGTVKALVEEMEIYFNTLLDRGEEAA